MTRQAFQPEGRPKPKPPYSPVVVAGDAVYTAGQTGTDAAGNMVAGEIAEQTPQTLENARACVEAAGSTMDDFFSEPYPARTSVQAGLPAGVLVEIEAIARRSR